MVCSVVNRFPRLRHSARAITHTRLGRYALAAVCATALSLITEPASTTATLAATPQGDAPLSAALATSYMHTQSPVALPQVQVERILTARRGESMSSVFQRAGFSATQVRQLVSAMGNHGKELIKASTEVTLRYTESAPYIIEDAALTFRPQPDVEASLSLKGSAQPQVAAKFQTKPLIQNQAVAVGHIESSLYADATDAGLPPAMVKQFMDIFAFDIDYTRDIHPGDTFKVTYEETVNDLGQRVKTGRILAAAFTVNDETRQAFYYNGEYLNEKGESKRKLLMRTPLEVYRISSNFGARRHPVLGFTRMHKGTDFAAPMGTPVKASGDGVVTYVGVHGGHGNYVAIRHNSTYSTAYAHLSRYARGLRPGQRVSQGQIIAFVGSTGISTGPHLHYEVMKNGTQVDAMRTDLPTGNLLAARDKRQFLAMVNGIQTAWNKALSGTRLASR